MDDRNAISIIDNTNLQRLTVRGRFNEHRHVGIVGLEASPVVSQCMEDVGIGDTVLAGARGSVAISPHIAPAAECGTERC